MCSLFAFLWGLPGLMELVIVAFIIGFPVVVVIVALLIVQQQSQHRELRAGRPTVPPADEAAPHSEPADVEVVEKSGNEERPAGG